MNSTPARSRASRTARLFAGCAGAAMAAEARIEPEDLTENLVVGPSPKTPTGAGMNATPGMRSRTCISEASIPKSNGWPPRWTGGGTVFEDQVHAAGDVRGRSGCRKAYGTTAAHHMGGQRRIAVLSSRWNGLARFLDDGRIEMDTNSVERAVRPIALNQKK